MLDSILVETEVLLFESDLDDKTIHAVRIRMATVKIAMNQVNQYILFDNVIISFESADDDSSNFLIASTIGLAICVDSSHAIVYPSLNENFI